MSTFHLTRKEEASHIALYGDTGTFKSQLITQILIGIEERGETAVVWDPNRQYLPYFYSGKRQDWVLDPSVAICPWWNIGDEVEDAAGATGLATCFFPPIEGQRDPYWQQSATQFLAWLLYQNPRYDTAKLAWLMANDHELNPLVTGTEFETMIAKNAPQTRAGVVGHLNTAAQPLRLMPSDRQRRREFTVREWDETRQGWLFLTCRPQHAIAMRTLHSAWIGAIIQRVLDRGKRTDVPRLWLIFEETSTLKVAEFHTALIRLRSTDTPVVYAIQNYADVDAAFGKQAPTIFSQAYTKFVGRTSDPDSAKRLKETVGDKTVKRLRETRDYRFGNVINRRRSFSTEKVPEPVVTQQVIENLPDRHVLMLQPGILMSLIVPIVHMPDPTPLPPRIIPEIQHRPMHPQEVTGAAAAVPSPDGEKTREADPHSQAPPSKSPQPSPPAISGLPSTHRYTAIYAALLQKATPLLEQALKELPAEEQVYFSPFDNDLPDKMLTGSLAYACSALQWVDGLVVCRQFKQNPNTNSLWHDPMIPAWAKGNVDAARLLMATGWDPLMLCLDDLRTNNLARGGNMPLTQDTLPLALKHPHVGELDQKIVPYHISIQKTLYLRPKLATFLLRGVVSVHDMHLLQLFTANRPEIIQNPVVRTAAIVFATSAQQKKLVTLSADVCRMFQVILP